MFDLPSASRNDERSNGVLAKSEGLCQTEMLYVNELAKTIKKRSDDIFDVENDLLADWALLEMYQDYKRRRQ